MMIHCFPNPAHVAGGATYDHYEIMKVGEFHDAKGRVFCEPVDPYRELPGALRMYWTIYGHRHGQGVEDLMDLPTEREAIQRLATMGIVRLAEEDGVYVYRFDGDVLQTGTYGSKSLGTASSTMITRVDEQVLRGGSHSLLIEWRVEFKNEERLHEDIGIDVVDGVVIGYDGVMMIPAQAVQLLVFAGLSIDQDVRR